MQTALTKFSEIADVGLASRVIGPVDAMSFVDQSLLFSELSILAYCPPTVAAEQGRKIGFPSATRIFDEDSNCVSYVFANDHDVVIAFRGVDAHSTGNLDEIADCELTPDGSLPGLVHDGFRQGLNHVWAMTAPMVSAFCANRKVWTTGHSMGGAMAVLLAGRAAHNLVPYCIESIFTFGCPRAGNRKYVRSVSTPHIRWVNSNDLVTNLPFSFFGYGYRHHGKEHFINSDGQIENSLTGRAKRSILSLLGRLPISVEDHSIFSYRARLLRLSTEGANGQR